MSSAYIMVVLGILLAKGLGFYRDMVFAKVFGTGVMADIYFQVFGLVNLMFTGIGVALSTLVIKNMNKPHNAGKERAYVAYFLKRSFIYLFIAALAIVFFAPQVVSVIMPEISGADLELAIKLVYVMAPSLIFVVIAYIISGILQNEKVFFITAIMSLPFNLSIILALNIPNVSIYTVGIVTTIGWFLHIVILLPSFYKKQYSLIRVRDKYSGKNDKNMEILWIFISNMMFQLCFYTDRAFVGGSEGMASTFNYASNLFITISSVFVVAMSTVVFPSISKNYEEGNIDYVNKLLKYIITIMTAIFLPFLLVIGFFGSDVIRLVYQRGSFTMQDTMAVSTILFIYSLGILGYVCQELFNKVIYLAGKYKYSVSGTIVVVTLNIIINILIKSFMPETMIAKYNLTTVSVWVAVTTSLLLMGYAVLIAIGIKKVVGPYWKKDLIFDLVKIFVSGIVATIAYIVMNNLMPQFTHGYISFIVPLMVCGILYIASLFVTGILKKLTEQVR